jgi:hypothetical protein
MSCPNLAAIAIKDKSYDMSEISLDKSIVLAY